MLDLQLYTARYAGNYLLRNVSKFKHVQGISITTNNLILPTISKKHHTLFLVDLDCNETVKLLQEANQLQLFKDPYRWIILSVRNISLFDSFNIYSNSDVILVNHTFGLLQLYKIGVISPFKYEDYGQWMPENKTLIDHRSIKIISQRRRNLEHYQLKTAVSVLNKNSPALFGTYKKPHIDTIVKSNYILMQLLYEILNCTAKYVFYDELGAPVYAGTPPKFMFKSIADGEVDLSGNSFLTLESRLMVKFIAPTGPVRITILFRKPRLSYVENLFTLTFDKSTWIAISVLVVLSLIFLYGVIRMENKYKRFQYNHSDTNYGLNGIQAGLSEIILITIGTITQQGIEREPRTTSSRMVLFMLLMSLMFIYTAYTANIVVILQSTSQSIRTLKNLADSKLKFGAEDFQLRPHFLNITIPERQYLSDRKLKNLPDKEKFLSLEGGIRRLREEPFAFATLPTIAYHIVEQTFFDYEKCQISEIQFSNGVNIYVVAPFNSTYDENFRVGFHKLFEFGHTKRVWSRFYSKKPNCDHKPTFFTSASIEDVYFAFQLFVYGLFLAIFVWILEYLIHKFYLKKRL
ncbi:ionotropic receptor 75a-like [Chrysoperla carnea]|uniref:ionotropic receptor 75a-like n=1 Tax=Chrysoperla carnea TaxID=189513 RepID=UPI001D07E095|nr:ionotropic receptor 75a-like [Chrysoperla carnea]